jgi:catechol 2,3-dioxygenase-like lactoylglutathione lyase family enzyme
MPPGSRVSAPKMAGLDHLVLVVADVAATCAFYERVLGLAPREERPGKWSLHFGRHKISLQDVGSVPKMAKGTVPGAGNFCILSDTPMVELMAHLDGQGVTILDGPVHRSGATGPIVSVYFHDPDGNLVELSNPL